MHASSPDSPRSATDEVLPRNFGGYVLLREIGRGAMGVVYEASQVALGRRVAIKTLRSRFDSSPNERERFRREARACAQVRHDHIVPIFEAGEVDGQAFYAMDLAEGTTLADRIDKGDRPEPRSLVRALAGVADALDALHRAGFVHRDVKPSNILVRADGRMMLADFGLAHATLDPALTQTGDVVGTPLYISPEQVLGVREAIDARTDVYGLGATLYEALSGRPVFSASSIPALMTMILEQRPRPLRAIEPGIPADCERIIETALEKRREDRYPSAAAMRQDMNAFADGQPVRGRPVSSPIRAARAAAARWPFLATTVVALAGFAFYWTHRAARLAVNSTPDAEVVVDGDSKGRTPVELSISPGSHSLLVRDELFVDDSRTLELAPGADQIITTTLWPRDPADRRALQRLGSALGVRIPALDLPRIDRDPPQGPAVELLVPQGDVRARDVGVFVLDVDGTRFPGGGQLELRRGDEVLTSSPFDPRDGLFEVSVPPGVQERLHVGDRVTWGWWPSAGPPVTAAFRIVDDSIAPDAERIRARIGALPDHAAELLQAELELGAGLNSAAYLDVRSLVSTSVGLPARMVMRRALDALGLRATRHANALAAAIRSAPRADLERLLGRLAEDDAGR